MDRVGLIIASGLGPYIRTFRFLDGILDGGDTNASPTDFSHSVHGAAAAYITELLDLRGPGLTVTDFENSFEQSIQLAQCWLDSDTCDRVLVGAVEELGDLLVHCASRLDSRLKPGEGAVFFTLGPSSLAGLAYLDATGFSSQADMQITDEPPILPVTKALQPTTIFTPYFGHLATVSAFQILGGLLSFTAGRPLGKVLRPPQSTPVDSATTLKPLWRSTSATLFLRKQNP
jgi:Beta-ketoacyl synthase, N-terminal domain